MNLFSNHQRNWRNKYYSIWMKRFQNVCFPFKSTAKKKNFSLTLRVWSILAYRFETRFRLNTKKWRRYKSGAAAAKQSYTTTQTHITYRTHAWSSVDAMYGKEIKSCCAPTRPPRYACEWVSEHANDGRECLYSMYVLCMVLAFILNTLCELQQQNIWKKKTQLRASRIYDIHWMRFIVKSYNSISLRIVDKHAR